MVSLLRYITVRYIKVYYYILLYDSIGKYTLRTFVVKFIYIGQCKWYGAIHYVCRKKGRNNGCNKCFELSIRHLKTDDTVKSNKWL